jgi:hypothetical protein
MAEAIQQEVAVRLISLSSEYVAGTWPVPVGLLWINGDHIRRPWPLPSRIRSSKSWSKRRLDAQSFPGQETHSLPSSISSMSCEGPKAYRWLIPRLAKKEHRIHTGLP